MTISYSGPFLTLLARWKGSLWRSVWRELLVWLAGYYGVRIVYKYAMTDEQRCAERKITKNCSVYFEYLSNMFDYYTSIMPLTFLLGFYIGEIVKRWWIQFEFVVFPDDFMSACCLVFTGQDDDSRRCRHMIARYVNLTSILAWRNISPKIRRRFPTVKHVVDSGMMTAYEYAMFSTVPVNLWEKR